MACWDLTCECGWSAPRELIDWMSSPLPHLPPTPSSRPTHGCLPVHFIFIFGCWMLTSIQRPGGCLEPPPRSSKPPFSTPLPEWFLTTNWDWIQEGTSHYNPMTPCSSMYESLSRVTPRPVPASYCHSPLSWTLVSIRASQHPTLRLDSFRLNEEKWRSGDVYIFSFVSERQPEAKQTSPDTSNKLSSLAIGGN